MPLTLQQRLLALSPRERKFLGVGVLAVLLFIVFMLLPGSNDAASDGSVEIVQAPPPAAAPPPPPAPTVSYAPAPPPPPSVPAASASGVVLKGVLSTGAILFVPPGTERLVRIGREFMPGMTLKEVGVHHAIIGGPGGDVRIELGRPGATPVQAAAAVPPRAAGGGADHRGETMQYRLGLQPVASNGRVEGYAIKPGASLPHFQNAGLQPGDVIVRVNGSGFNEERLMELSWDIRNSTAVEFEFIRDGRRMKTTLSKQ